MKYIIIHRTDEYRGDHSADILMVHEHIEGDTVKQVADALIDKDSDWIEIRRVVPREER